MVHNSEPYLKCARFLATWLRIRIGMLASCGCSFAIMVISGVQMGSDGGSLGIAGWNSNICQAMPYSYLKPFSFTTAGGSSAAYCGWPDSNTDLRLCASVFGFLSVFALFFHSPISKGARTILLFFTSIHFASFVLDASQSIAGGSACSSKFPNTGLGSAIGGQSITCNTVNYPGLCALNFIQVVLYYLLFECWSMCSNLYGKSSGDDDDDDKPKKKRRGHDDEEEEEEGGTTTKNPLQEFDEDEEDGEGRPRKGYKKLTPEQAAALEAQGKKKSWCPIL